MTNPLFFEQTYINGSLVSSHRTFDIINPATGHIVGKMPDLTGEDCNKAILHAYEAWNTWKYTSLMERTTKLKKLFNLVAEHKENLAELMTFECGKPYQESLVEVDYSNSFIEWFAEESKRAYGETIPSLQSDMRLMTIKQSVGVVGAITPWNFPLAMLTRKIAPALAAGCTVVLKPASKTPFTAVALAVLAEKAGIPSGVLNIITSTDSKSIGQVIATHPLVRKISFTGSTAVGRSLAEQAAGTLKRVSLELGGNAPFIVFDDADIDKAVKGAIVAKFRNSGQTCVSANRFYVQDKIYDEFANKLAHAVAELKIGNGMDENVQVGPLINQKGLEKVKSHVRDAVAHGAQVIMGGESIRGLFFEPTVLTNISNSSIIAREETFGPICALFKFETEEQVIAQANDSEFGLAAYFFSENIHRAFRVAEQLESGMVGINTGKISDASAPFGGVKQSGVGREGSKYGLEEYMEIKYLCYGS